MKPVKTITLPDWLPTQDLEDIFSCFGKGQILLVGGCVRNALMTHGETDIDLATPLKPQEVMEKFRTEGWKVIPTGFDHGTVTVVLKGRPYEVTTLRKDIATDGRHAVVGFTDDWLEDARRRDFTINALYMDLDGRIFDPTGQGLDDVANGQVRFVGRAAQRVQEDYLRILRFFRFWAWYGKGVPDDEGLQACARYAKALENISRERITQEFLKILDANGASETLEIMFAQGILTDLPHSSYSPATLKILVALQVESGAQNIFSRLFIIGGCQPHYFEKYLRLSHQQKNFLVKLIKAIDPALYTDRKEVKKAIFYHGNDLLVQGYLLRLAMEGEEPDPAILELLQNWQAPECPVTGATLLAEGYQTGPELGQELERRVKEWVEKHL